MLILIINVNPGLKRAFCQLKVFFFVNQLKKRPVRLSLCVCVRDREAESFVYTESTALLTALDWTGLDWSGLDQVGLGLHQMRVGVEGAGSELGWGGVGWGGQTGWWWGEWDQSGMQPSLRQHKQHADTVTGNIVIIIILLFKVSLKTSKLYKKEENRFFALMKNTFFDFSLLQRRF